MFESLRRMANAYFEVYLKKYLSSVCFTHLSILAKSSENLTFFGQFFKKYVWEFSQIFSIKFLMRFRSSGEKPAPKRSKKGEFLQS